MNPQSRNLSVFNPQPKNSNFLMDFGTEQMYTSTIKKGQSIGLLLALTYPTQLIFTTNRSY